MGHHALLKDEFFVLNTTLDRAGGSSSASMLADMVVERSLLFPGFARRKCSRCIL